MGESEKSVTSIFFHFSREKLGKTFKEADGKKTLTVNKKDRM